MGTCHPLCVVTCCSSVPPRITLSLRAASKHLELLCRPTFLLSAFIFLLGMRAEGWSARLPSLAVSLFLKLSDSKSEEGPGQPAVTCKVHGLHFHASEAQPGFRAAMSRRNGTLLGAGARAVQLRKASKAGRCRACVCTARIPRLVHCTRNSKCTTCFNSVIFPFFFWGSSHACCTLFSPPQPLSDL